MGKARFSVSYELLRQALNLPIGTNIAKVLPLDTYPRSFDVFVTHPDIPVSADGGWTLSCPVFRHQEQDVLESWGIEDEEPA